ncbi:MAG: nitroreductase family protein [Nitrososphaeraceae archaeon]|nr:nitroreductase family protein [Nitrososphaeraceae archaeon]MDW0146695.1 nitroreductase family protein [Nitrososphaeraceae archaeon]
MSFPSDIFARMFTDKNTQLIYPKEEVPSHDVADIVQTNIFNVMLNRRSQRKFENRDVEEWKLEMIFAAADTAPTAGGFQGFEIYHIKNQEIKNKLVEAANNQPYVNAPVVLVFCMNPKRIKLNFPPETIRKFSQQDATLAAAYSQLAAHALGLSSIWIGMLDENKIRQVLSTELSPSSILCAGYPVKMLVPKPKRNLKDLIHEI